MSDPDWLHDPSWFSYGGAKQKKARHVPPPPPPPPPPSLQRGDAVELAIEVERELGLTAGAAVVWRKALYRLNAHQWVEVHDAELSRRVAAYAGRETAKGPLYLTVGKVRGAVAMLKMRWPTVVKLPASKEASDG